MIVVTRRSTSSGESLRKPSCPSIESSSGPGVARGKFYDWREYRNDQTVLYGSEPGDHSSRIAAERAEVHVQVRGERTEVTLESLFAQYKEGEAKELNVILKADVQGSIEVGKRADFVVIDRNLFEVPASEISDARVTMTIFDGRTVYE